nr:Chain A, IGF-1 ANTAGONIST F1-1 [synthetic construct]1PMX_B Chain B, IGF-1 ANTAGONIST F1-1 [synthetic construct]
RNCFESVAALRRCMYG